jgi:hypothetical protein
MEIGKPRRVHKVEPLREPVPREAPARPAEAPKAPAK